MIVVGFGMNSCTDGASRQAALADCGPWLLAALHELCGGELLRVDLAQAAPLGCGHTYRPALPIVQLSTVIGGAQ